MISSLLALRSESRAAISQRFFRTGKGDYGYGDKFLGIANPQVRQLVKTYDSIPLSDIHDLLMSEWHEARLCGVLILSRQFGKLCTIRLADDPQAVTRRDELLLFYLSHAERINNWDLVDLSVSDIVGRWLLLPTFLGHGGQVPCLAEDYKRSVLDELAASTNLWKQRMSMVCTSTPIRQGNPMWTLRYAEKHVYHPHDLMHKAVGWMLREVGKHCGMDILRSFLETYASTMPRTALRYAIEKMTDEERRYWMTRRRA